MESIIAFLVANSVIILGALLAVSEALALIPALKSNSVLTLIVNLIKGLMGKKG